MCIRDRPRARQRHKGRSVAFTHDWSVTPVGDAILMRDCDPSKRCGSSELLRVGSRQGFVSRRCRLSRPGFLGHERRQTSWIRCHWCWPRWVAGDSSNRSGRRRPAWGELSVSIRRRALARVGGQRPARVPLDPPHEGRPTLWRRPRPQSLIQPPLSPAEKMRGFAAVRPAAWPSPVGKREGARPIPREIAGIIRPARG